jgi:hypothetical protein
MSIDNRTIINDCEANTGWTGDDTATLNSDAGQFYQNANSLSTQLSNADEQMSTTQDSVGASTFSLDWSDSTLYLLVKDNLQGTAANGGVQFVVGDGTDLIGYDVGGNDATGMSLPTYFNCYKLDMSNRPAGFTVFAGVEANLTDTAITEIGYGSIHLAKAVGAVDNVFMDCFRYIANDSYALTINGGTVGTPETMVDVQGDDATASNGWGMISNPLGSQYLFFAPTEWGTPSGTADSYFTADDEQWYWIGDNGGGHALGATHFPFRMIGNATGTNSFVANNVVIVNTGTRAQFDLSDANMDFVQFTGCTFTELGTITGTPADADKFINTSTFNNCDQVLVGSMNMDGCVFNGTTNALGAVFWDASTTEENQDNLTFRSDGTGHAIEISLNTASLTTYNIDGYTVTGYETANDTATGNTVFLVDNALDGDVTINVSAGSGTFSYERASGYTGTVTINQNVTVTFDGLRDNTEVRVYNNATGVELDGIENATAGTTDDRNFAASIAGSTVVDYVLHNNQYEYIRVEAFTWPSVAQTINIQQRFDRNFSNP